MGRLMHIDWPAIRKNHVRAYHGFLSVVNALPPDLRAAPGVTGDWSPKDVVAHFIFWEDEAATRMEAFLRGESAAVDYDIEAVNAETVERYRASGWEAVLLALDSAHRRLQAVCDRVSTADLALNDGYIGWLRARTADFRHHTHHIEAWLD